MSLEHRREKIKKEIKKLTPKQKERIEFQVHAMKMSCMIKASDASKKTHYDKLNEWSDSLYELVRIMLKEYGFKNGDVEHNAKFPCVQIWYGIYGILGSICYSQYLRTQVSSHHASAFERNEALIAELEEILKLLQK